MARLGDSMLFYENKFFIGIRDPLMFMLVNVKEKNKDFLCKSFLG